jgi:hypothetical protein
MFSKDNINAIGIGIKIELGTYLFLVINDKQS